ncbi:hypothetical protein [Promicromonospora sp. NPDC060271]|uniref:hypothetical protein n=1 Tax=Promicromonospora sp. NPDC060271 TaxID=3347089 RepID=UPI00365A6158
MNLPRHASGVAGASVPAPSGPARRVLTLVSRASWLLAMAGLVAFIAGALTGTVWLVGAGTAGFLTGTGLLLPAALGLALLPRTGGSQ